MDQIPQSLIFNKKDQCPSNMDLPVSEQPYVFVSSRDESDKDSVKIY